MPISNQTESPTPNVRVPRQYGPAMAQMGPDAASSRGSPVPSVSASDGVFLAPDQAPPSVK